MSIFLTRFKRSSLTAVGVSLLAICSLTSSLAFAESVNAPAVPETVKQVITTQLKKIVPDAPKLDIQPSPIASLYQVTMGPMVVYMSADGRYLVNGSVIDLKTQQNLTAQAKADAIKHVLAKVPESSMIVYPAKGKQKHVITVFTDIDCPYCHKLHKEIPKLNEAGITVRYLSYPRAGIGSRSYQKAVSVWCQADRAKAMSEAMQGKVSTVKPSACQNPVSSHFQLAQLMAVNGTPTIILENGEVIPGYVPAEKLISALENLK